MHGTQDCIARRLCKYDFPKVTRRYQVNTYIASGKLLTMLDCVKCHLWSLENIYESVCNEFKKNWECKMKHNYWKQILAPTVWV